MRRSHLAALGAVAIALAWLALRAPDRAKDAPTSPEPSAATPAPAPPSPTATTPARAPATIADDDEDAIMAQIQDELDREPSAALARARAADARGLSRRADERAYLEMRALVNQRDISGARAAAEKFYVAYPGSRWGPRVHALTGLHPPPHLGPD